MAKNAAPTIEYRLNPPISSEAINELFATSWPKHRPRDFMPILSRSLAYVCAYEGERFVGFVNLAWDGGIHAFLLDITVHPDVRHHGIGQQLVREAIKAAQARQIEWLHVDYELQLEAFYQSCSFAFTNAGVMQLNNE